MEVQDTGARVNRATTGTDSSNLLAGKVSQLKSVVVRMVSKLEYSNMIITSFDDVHASSFHFTLCSNTELPWFKARPGTL